MVDVINRTVAITDIDQYFQHRENIFAIQYTRSFNFFTPDPAVELHPANARQVIALFGEEQVLEQILRGILGRRLTRTHHAINLHQGFELVGGGINFQCI